LTSLRKNILANLVGKVWSAAIVILLIPKYVHYLGIESYGLVGFYTTLIGSMAILDLGLSITLNRELAQFSHSGRTVREVRDLSFSLEIVYWIIGLFICGGILLCSDLIATKWINAEKLPADTVKNAVMLMGLIVALQWPVSLYSGGLTGLERQVLNNSISVFMVTLRSIGALLVIMFYSPTIEAFFMWHGVVTLLYVILMRTNFWRAMPKSGEKNHFSKPQLQRVWKFAAGMTGIGVITFFLSQVDKIILSKKLLLSFFGYYSMAFSVASGIGLIAASVSVAYFPRFSSLVAGNKHSELANLYHSASRLMAAVVFPIGVVLLFFMPEILQVWTRNSTTVLHTSFIAQILIAGSVLNALMIIPYNLLLAHGRTRFTIVQNTIAVIVLIPLLLWLTDRYGGVGAAWVWFIVNAGYVLISQPLMHRRLLKGELMSWYLHEVLLPLIICLVPAGGCWLLLHYVFPEHYIGFIELAIISLVTFALSMGAVPEIRKAIQNKVFKNKADAA
jgi:O-antigen/teichoic acid export membrane protein